MKVRVTDTLLYYDGPRVVLAVDQNGAYYVADLVTEDHEDEQYQAVRAGPDSLGRLLGGQIDLRALLLQEGSRRWFLSDPDASDGEELVLTKQDIPICDSDTLPSSGVRMRCTEEFVAEVASRACVVEHHLGIDNGAGCFNNAVSEVVLQAGACVEHYKVQTEGDRTFHIANLEVRQAHESHFTSRVLSLGGRLVRHDVNVRLEAPHARCDLHGLYLAGGRQHMDFHTRVDHLEPHCTSTEVYKGVLGGRARAVFNGRVLVHPGARKSDARQTNDNLLLSPHAEVDAKPQLEIYADDVKCAHGATVGQLDESMVFYLRSRGLDERSARALLTFGFLREVLDRVDIAGLRESLTRELVRRLPAAPNLPDLGQESSQDG